MTETIRKSFKVFPMRMVLGVALAGLALLIWAYAEQTNALKIAGYGPSMGWVPILLLAAIGVALMLLVSRFWGYVALGVAALLFLVWLLAGSAYWSTVGWLPVVLTILYGGALGWMFFPRVRFEE